MCLFLLEFSVNFAALVWQIVFLWRDERILLPRGIPSRLQLSLFLKNQPDRQVIAYSQYKKTYASVQLFKSSCNTLFGVRESHYTCHGFPVAIFSAMYAPNAKNVFSIFCELRSEDEEMVDHTAQHIQKGSLKVSEINS